LHRAETTSKEDLKVWKAYRMTDHAYPGLYHVENLEIW